MSLHEQKIAEMEYASNKASDEYFAQRPQIDSLDRRKVFEAGFERAWRFKDAEQVY
jgi:hypothetical protein